MSDDYLWNGSRPADPEVEALERLLRPLRSVAPPPRIAAFPARARRRRLLVPALALAASLLLAVAFGWRTTTRPPPPNVATTNHDTAGSASAAWAITSLAGSPVVGDRTIEERAPLAVGDTVATDQRSRARITSEEVGEVVVDPGSRVRLVASGGGRHRLALERGVLQAFIVAPPGRFVVETPSATAVDLGCVYTLRVGENGDGVLSVEAGWVGFEFNGRESFVPAGASCPTTKARGPGVPRFEDAAPGFIRAIDRLEMLTDARERDTALRAALQAARPRDAVTLWHLLPRVSGAERVRVAEALNDRVPLPEGVSLEAVLRLERDALDRWWDQLGLGAIRTWREWTRPLPLR